MLFSKKGDTVLVNIDGNDQWATFVRKRGTVVVVKIGGVNYTVPLEEVVPV